MNNFGIIDTAVIGHDECRLVLLFDDNYYAIEITTEPEDIQTYDSENLAREDWDALKSGTKILQQVFRWSS